MLKAKVDKTKIVHCTVRINLIVKEPSMSKGWFPATTLLDAMHCMRARRHPAAIQVRDFLLI